MPATSSREFGYADDWSLAISHRIIEYAEIAPTDNLTLSEYLKK